MQVFVARICKLLRDPADEVNGFALDNGVKVHFPTTEAKRVLEAAPLGSHVEVHARLRGNPAHDIAVNAILITNLDSKRSTSLYTPPTQPSPEASTDAGPSLDIATPLAPPPKSGPTEPYLRRGERRPFTLGHELSDEIEEAYDSLHRIQATLAYVKMMDQREIRLSQFLDEAQHTYLQSLSRHAAGDIEGSLEFAVASCSLSHMVEILISRIFHTNSSYPKLVPPPPAHLRMSGEAEMAQYELDRVECMLARIRWVIENGTLPSEDGAQVEKLSSWSKSLHRQARHFFENGAIGDAIELAYAAAEGACSAEHLCKKCYVTRGAISQRAASTR